MAASLIRQTIREESPLILQTATEVTITASSSSVAIGSMAANAARTAAVATVEAASSTGVKGILSGGKMGSEVITRESGAVIGESSILSSHLAAVKQTATHTHTTPTSVETALPHTIPQPTITTATGPITPSALTSPIARKALTSTTRTTHQSTLARMDLNVAQTAESVKEAISNAVQEGLEEQLDKAMDMQKVTVAAAAAGGPVEAAV